ncbi:MAG: 3-oxoacyl-[acyl-carrier-protein] reductase [Ignavibacteria bacterium]|nr:3-oxoacyl-[acyl-carrier-protein] reductase [Ignavibacteria bacterium]
MYNFTGKTVIVTGGSRGIGKSIAERFAASGASVYITYKNAVDAEYFDSRGIKHSRCDVADFAEVQTFTENVIKSEGKIDILVNNAGMTKDGLLIRMSSEDWDVVMNTNAKGVFNFTKAVCRHMMSQRHGKIINISSVVGIVGNAGQANYVSSKAAVIGFTKAVAKELASRNINVNCIAPGYIDTDMTSKLSDTIKQSILESVPMKRIGSGEDVAKAVAFLASDDAGYITGQVLCVDGGMVM